MISIRSAANTVVTSRLEHIYQLCVHCIPVFQPIRELILRFNQQEGSQHLPREFYPYHPPPSREEFSLKMTHPPFPPFLPNINYALAIYIFLKEGRVYKHGRNVRRGESSGGINICHISSIYIFQTKLLFYSHHDSWQQELR